MWEMLKKKDVRDFDGFWTEYTLYTNGELFVCIFGDSDLYTPEDSDWDWEGEDEEEAKEWFDSYDTCYDEENEKDSANYDWDWYDDNDPDTVNGWIQQDVIDMYRRER